MDTRDLDEALGLVPGLVSILRQESDRGCILVASAMVETELEAHILRRLWPCDRKSDELLSRSMSAPISSFSSKINLAYRIGLIPESERNICHQLRELRNASAHDITRQEFTENHFKDRTTNIIKESTMFWESLRAATAKQVADGKQPGTVRELVELMTWRYAFEFFFALHVAYKKVQLPRVPQLTAVYAA